MELKRGPKRQADAILMAIKATVLEAESRFKRGGQPTRFDFEELIGKLKACYHHGYKFIAPVYLKWMAEIDSEIERMYESHDKEVAEREKRKREGIQRWS